MGAIKEAYFSLVNILKSLGYDTAESGKIAAWLFEDNISKDYSSEREITPSEVKIFEEIQKRVNLNEPWQYISGKVNFYGYNFFINHHVLIPRPETEELVYHTLKAIPKESNLQILDVGTGSGIIALTIAKNRPLSQIFGVDISEEALNVAQQNCKNLDIPNAGFKQINFLDESSWKIFPPLDIIVSNPPYITYDEKKFMSASTLQYEPPGALFVASDPMEFYVKIAILASRQRRPVKVFVEINEFRAMEVIEVFRKMGLVEVCVINDMQGKKRIVTATKV